VSGTGKFFWIFQVSVYISNRLHKFVNLEYDTSDNFLQIFSQLFGLNNFERIRKLVQEEADGCSAMAVTGCKAVWAAGNPAALDITQSVADTDGGSLADDGGS
jgi:hypothetical protein